MILTPSSLAYEKAYMASSSEILPLCSEVPPTCAYYCMSEDSDSSEEISACAAVYYPVKLLRSSVLLEC